MFKKIRKVATNVVKPRKRFIETKYNGYTADQNRNAITTWWQADYAAHVDNITR